MNATQVSKDPQVCRTSSKRKLLSAGLIAGLVAVLSGIPAVAGTSTDAEITDPAGDANFLSGVTADQRDTRPASADNADLRAVWFETAYSTTKIEDASGAVLHVEHRPTALLVLIQTQGPVRPLSPWTAIRFKVPFTVPTCAATIELLVATNATADSADIVPATGATCWEDIASHVISPVKPAYAGAVSTLTFPLSHNLVSQFISTGTTLTPGSASANPGFPTGAVPTPSDKTSAGRAFTVGQDVPADIDCSADPGNAECQS